MSDWLVGRQSKPITFFLATLPLLWLVWGMVADRLGANPAEAVVRATGDWTLRMLCIVLTVTPLRIIAQVPSLARMRRMLGLFVYFYATSHLLAYAWFDMGFEPADIANDIAKRPFILVGFTAFLLLTALAVTSFNRVVRALGGRNWRRLHRSVYVVAMLALLHFFWMRAGKNNFAEVAVYALVLGILLAWRVARNFGKNTQ